KDMARCKDFLENCGERPRVYCNTLIFLCPLESERIIFDNFVKKRIAWQLIEIDKTLRLTDEQKKGIKEKIKRAGLEEKEHLRNLYRLLLLPSKDELKEIDLGIPTYGADVTMNKEVYERLRSDGELLEKFSPLSLNEKYLKDRDFVETKNILESFFRTPGEIRIVRDDVLKNSIKEGVKQGLFGVGEIEKGEPLCRYFKDEFSPEISEGEILIKAELCKPKEDILDEEYVKKIEDAKRIGPPVSPSDNYRKISLKLNVPSGKLSDITKMVNYIKTKFAQVNVRVEIFSQDGEMAVSEYDDKIKEAINQAGVSVEEERIE
ncbi:AAA family ATPase, partial [bacterium]|nr:AAA family ATPase [bacterium]